MHQKPLSAPQAIWGLLLRGGRREGKGRRRRERHPQPLDLVAFYFCDL